MLKYMKKYSDSNPERFNKEFIRSRSDDEVLDYVKDIFKSLEVIDEVKVNWVKMDTDESSFPPIIFNNRFYKAIDPSRINRIRYSITFSPSKRSRMTPILTDSWENINDISIGKDEEAADSFTVEKELFVNKLIDDTFYINEGSRYSLIYQIVDNSTYGVSNSVSLKSLLMPIQLTRLPNVELEVMNGSEGPLVVTVNPYETSLFNNRINPIMYVMGKYAYNYLISEKVTPNNVNFGNEIEEVVAIKNYKKGDEIPKVASSETSILIANFNEFFNVDIEVADEVEYFEGDQYEGPDSERIILKIAGRGKQSTTYISAPRNKVEEKENQYMVVIGLMSYINARENKKRITFTAEDFFKPVFWVKETGGFFTRNKDIVLLFNKLRTSLISLDRLMDDPTRRVLNTDWFHKRNTLTILRYMLYNFDDLLKQDSQDLVNKRLRLYEYQLYPLRKYFSDQIYTVLNSPTRTKNVLNRMISNLKPMYVIRKTVTSELLRYYNQVNEMNLFTMLTYTFRGPQSVNRTVSMKQRDLHPSYVGNLSLIASNASDPGMSGTLVPFIDPVNYFFTEQTNIGYYSEEDKEKIKDRWEDYINEEDD